MAGVHFVGRSVTGSTLKFIAEIVIVFPHVRAESYVCGWREDQTDQLHFYGTQATV